MNDTVTVYTKSVLTGVVLITEEESESKYEPSQEEIRESMPAITARQL